MLQERTNPSLSSDTKPDNPSKSDNKIEYTEICFIVPQPTNLLNCNAEAILRNYQSAKMLPNLNREDDVKKERENDFIPRFDCVYTCCQKYETENNEREKSQQLRSKRNDDRLARCKVEPVYERTKPPLNRHFARRRYNR